MEVSMWAHVYVAEKMRQLDEERLSSLKFHQQQRPRSRPMFAPMILAAGRALHRAGESLESWGIPPSEPDEACC
jgi:hypothetical protein